ncbi:hypothetical protein GF342_04860 [Candidatus Woesearchaeota archaeon]|nr:hypothetical protein [Candidatus Woesearchaeota archaeon]
MIKRMQSLWILSIVVTLLVIPFAFADDGYPRSIVDIWLTASETELSVGELFTVTGTYWVFDGEPSGEWTLRLATQKQGIPVDGSCSPGELFEVLEANVSECPMCTALSDGSVEVSDQQRWLHRVVWTLRVCEDADKVHPIKLTTALVNKTTPGNHWFTDKTKTLHIGPATSVLGFTLTLPGQAPTNESTAQMVFNSSAASAEGVDPCVHATSHCQSSSVPFFVYHNTGTETFDLSILLDQEFPSVFELGVAMSYAPSAAVTVGTAPLFVGSLEPGSSLDAYFFGKFINAYPFHSTNRTLTSRGVSS